MTEHRGAEHFLQVTTDDDGMEIEVFHPEACNQAEVQYEGVVEYTCDIAHHIREWGYDLYLKDLRTGIYLAQFWSTPGGWAGPVAIDPDAGIDLTLLMIDESWFP